jgi:hypothetical protein
MFVTRKRFHCVGIGDPGMDMIAEALLDLGCSVTGSDANEGAGVRRLKGLGVEIRIARPPMVGDVDVVVTGRCSSPRDVEAAIARGRGIPVLSQAEMLDALMELKFRGRPAPRPAKAPLAAPAPEPVLEAAAEGRELPVYYPLVTADQPRGVPVS